MAKVRLTARAFADLERIFEFTAAHDPARAQRSIQRIREAIMILANHPLIGRVVEDGKRELIISRGRDAHVALSRWRPAEDTVLVLAIRHAREAGYSTD